MYSSTALRTGMLLLTVLLTSCIGTRKFTAPSYYDLGLAKKQDVKLKIVSILQEGPYRSRMVSRQGSSEVILNEYQRWTQSPDLMIAHYLKTAYVPGETYQLEGEIIAFENNLSTGKAVFIFNYEIFKKEKKVSSGSFRRENDSGVTAVAFAGSMSSIASELITEITEKVKSLQ